MESTANEKILAGEPMYMWVFLITAALGTIWYFLNTAIDFAEISRNWPKYRCNPAIMPFAGAYGYDASENFNYCMKNMFTSQVGSVTGPFATILTSIIGSSMTFLNSLNSLRLSVATMVGGLSKIIQEFSDRFKLLFSQVRISAFRIQTLFRRVFATMYSILYMGMSGVTAGLNFGDTFIFKFIDTFCFPPETPIEIKGRGYIPISDVKLGDVCAKNGAKVTSIYEFMADGQPMVRLGKIDVSTNHFVRYEGNWIQASEHPAAQPIADWNGGKSRPLVCLDTDSHEIPLGGYIFSDWDETSESDAPTMELAEKILNNSAPTTKQRDWLYQPCLDGETIVKTRNAFKPATAIQLGDQLETGPVVGVGRRSVTSWLRLPTGEIVTPSTLIWFNQSWVRAGHIYPDKIVTSKEPREMVTLVVFKTACVETLQGTVMRDMCEIYSPDMEAPTANALEMNAPNPVAAH